MRYLDSRSMMNVCIMPDLDQGKISMATNDFLARYGFYANPFESTNADDEPDLAGYFVPPPYFTSVMGDPTRPQSHITFAPRGGGKSAQRRMIEQEGLSSQEFLCVTYDHFDQPEKFRASDASWTYHLNQICRLMVVAILMVLEEKPKLVEGFDKRRRNLLTIQMDHFLGSLSAEDFATAVGAVKTFGDKASAFLRKYSGPISVVLEVVKKKYGLDINLPKAEDPLPKKEATLKFHLEQLVQTVRELGYASSYVLVDRVDELSITSTAPATFDLIKPMLSDLPTLETKGVAFKFFLWDAIEGTYNDSGFARRDRIPVYKLDWRTDELEQMMSLRMASYSARRCTSFNELVETDELDIHRLIALLAAGSPRDMIRLAGRIVAEAQRSTGEIVTKIPMAAVWSAIRIFANERANELFGNHLTDLRRVGTPNFTTKFLGSDVFRCNDNAARRKLQLWSQTGVVAKTGEIQNPPNRPSHLYSVIDPRVCLAAFFQDDPEFVLGIMIFECHSCGAACISEALEFRCHKCDAQLNLKTTKTILDSCTQRKVH